jgi:superfamily II DNA or RNA helicase
MADIKLRSYQTELESNVFGQWSQGVSNVLAVCPTGGGKSLTTASIIRNFGQPTCLIVHRAELVAQLSETLAQVGITHRVVAAKSTIQLCVSRQVRKFGKSFIHPQSPVGVVSVQTLISRGEELKQWCASVKLWVVDEAHHALGNNQWGKSIDLFPNARGLGVTATPLRCDNRSLARVQGGVFDAMVEGPSMKWLIDQGYLSPYRYIAENPSIHMTQEDISDSTGDFKMDAARKKSHESRIVGDIVESYLKYAAGRPGITFVVDIDTAVATAEAFNAAGVPAAAVSGKTPDVVRAGVMDKFASGHLKQLVNVDLFDEGLDVVGVEVVSMGRPTMSLGKFRQQAGRMIRPVYAKGMSLETVEDRHAAIAAGPKPKGIIIDHVNNWLIHKMPASPKIWSLVSPEKGKKSRSKDDEIPLTNCKSCLQPYERTHTKCPHCGNKPEPIGRSLPEQVDGDLVEFSPELMEKLHADIKRVDGPARIPPGTPDYVEKGMRNRWSERQEAQAKLRETIALWAGVWKSRGAEDSESYRRFFLIFNLDVMSACALGKSEALELTERIQYQIAKDLTSAVPAS